MRIRLIATPDPHPFLTQLEARARGIAGRDRSMLDAETKTLHDRLALTVEHLDRTRELHRTLSRSLVRVECYIRTELMQMEQRTPRYSPYRFPEREKLQRRLGELEKERRAQSVTSLEREHALHARMLELLEDHAAFNAVQ